MTKYHLAEETLGYVTSTEKSNTDFRFLIGGSKNVLVDYQRKVRTRSGYTRLGDSATTLVTSRNAKTWETSTDTHLPLRCNDGLLEVYLNSVDGTAINDWTQVRTGFSTTKKLRWDFWFDNTEKIDVMIMVNGDANIYEWNGAVAIVDSIAATTITKTGTPTFAQNRFYTAGNKTLVCVRTGTEYTYTGGESTTTLTGIADTTGIVAGDILIQKVVTRTDKPLANHTNDVIFVFENQAVIGSYADNLVYISKNSDYTSVATSTPRVAGEGVTLTLDSPCRGINIIGKKLVLFSGRSSIYKVDYEQITVGTTLAETVKVKKINTGVDQGALNHECIVPIGDSLAYISNEPALRIIDNPEELTGINPKTFSNPIKPDFDAEDWTDAFGFWYKNILFFTAPVTGRMYMLNFVEDADGKLFRFWNPPQTIPVGPLSIINSGDGHLLHGHSNSVAESYLLFDGASDGQYEDMPSDEKLPIHAKAKYAYNNYGDRTKLKALDEYYVEGEITANTTDLVQTLDYNFEGYTQQVQNMIDGSDEDILEGTVVGNSLAQESLAVNPLGGLLNPPTDARKFRVMFEIAKEDFHEISDTYETNDVDLYWSIISRGSNAVISPRRAINIRK